MRPKIRKIATKRNEPDTTKQSYHSSCKTLTYLESPLAPHQLVDKSIVLDTVEIRDFRKGRQRRCIAW
jgi:hypothetical protein